MNPYSTAEIVENPRLAAEVAISGCAQLPGEIREGEEGWGEGGGGEARLRGGEAANFLSLLCLSNFGTNLGIKLDTTLPEVVYYLGMFTRR